jgi:eight-cysteine-cluster-containing protein
MLKKDFFPLLIFSFFVFPLFVFADRGMIVWPPLVHLDQSAQNAIVAWNGKEEIIILSANIKSDASATALEILPLPSNPVEIKEGSFDSFEKLVEIMNRKIGEIRNQWLKEKGLGEAPTAGIEITFHEKIGAHEVTVVKVNDLDFFLNWVKDFTTKKNLAIKNISSEFREGIKNYLKRGINHFVFDVIEAEKGEGSINPLIFRFESDLLYYPLKITAVSEIGSSQGRIQIFLIAKDFIGEEFKSLFPVDFTKDELKEVSEDIANLFESEVKLAKFDYSGSLNGLNKDFILLSSGLWKRNLTLGSVGKDVKTLQKILINLGMWDSEVEATGFFGPITQRALAKFQEENKSQIGLEKGTGYFGQRTREFFERVAVETEEKPETPEITMKWFRNLYLGTEGDDVRALQEILIKEGIWPRPDVGATGFFGQITREGVIRFQEKYSEEILKPLGLEKGTGFIGSLTRTFLNKLESKTEDFCGWSTNGQCSLDSDCQSAGCSGQVCQSKSEEPILTTCEWRECYDKTKYGLTCKCVENKCQWSR